MLEKWKPQIPGKHRNSYHFFRQLSLCCWFCRFQVDGNERRKGAHPPASPRSVALRAKRKRERLGNGDWESGRTTGVFTYPVNIYYTGSPSWPKWNINGWFNGDLPWFTTFWKGKSSTQKYLWGNMLVFRRVSTWIMAGQPTPPSPATYPGAVGWVALKWPWGSKSTIE